MNSFEFLEELSGIDDDLILNAQTVPPKRQAMPKFSLRIAAVLAIIILLPLSVAAVTVSVRILTSGSEVTNYLIDQYTIRSKVTTIEYDLHPQKAKIPLQWTQELTEAWKTFGYDHSYFTGIDLKDGENRRNFGGIQQLEQLLGIPLVSSPELEAVTSGAYVTLAVTDQARAAAQFQSEGMVSPDGLMIYLPFRLSPETGLDQRLVEYCGLRVFVPLTDSFAKEYASHAVLSSVRKQDLQQTKLVSSGDIEIIMLENTIEEGIPISGIAPWENESGYISNGDSISGFAAWEKNGIGYLVEFRTYLNVEVVPSQLLTPYLEHLED